MRETEQARGAQAETPQVAEPEQDVSVARGKFSATAGDGVPPVASDTTVPKPTASEQAYNGVPETLDAALAKTRSQLATEDNKDRSAEIEAMMSAIRAEVVKRSTLAQKIETLLPTLVAAVAAQDESVIGPIKSELEGLGLYPIVVAAVAPTKHRPNKALDHR